MFVILRIAFSSMPLMMVIVGFTTHQLHTIGDVLLFVTETQDVSVLFLVIAAIAIGVALFELTNAPVEDHLTYDLV